jgi:hypothetical protein
MGFQYEYFGKFDSMFDTALGYKSGARWILYIYIKTGGQQS